jgi:hypothetical protein
MHVAACNAYSIQSLLNHDRMPFIREPVKDELADPYFLIAFYKIAKD